MQHCNDFLRGNSLRGHRELSDIGHRISLKSTCGPPSKLPKSVHPSCQPPLFPFDSLTESHAETHDGTAI